MTTTFDALGVSADLVTALAERGITSPFPIQELAVPDALAGRDVCGQAKTGSGKTLAFGLPIIERVGRAEPRRPRALVLVPTRELALQVHDELGPLGKPRGVRVRRRLRRRQHGAPDQGLRQGRRRRRRHAGPHDRPHRSQGDVGRRSRDRGDRRSRPHGRHGLPAAGRVDPAPGRALAPDAAVLGHPRRPGRHADQALPARSGDALDRVHVGHRRGDGAPVPAGAPDGQGQGHRSHRPQREPHHGLRAHQARRRPAGRAARARGRPRPGHPRRPAPDGARAGAGRLLGRQAARAGRHRRGRPRHPRRRRRHRRALRPARGPQGLPAPLGAHRPRRRVRRGRHARAVGPGARGQAADEAHRRRPSPSSRSSRTTHDWPTSPPGTRPTRAPSPEPRAGAVERHRSTGRSRDRPRRVPGMVAALGQVELASPPEASRARRRPRWVHRASVDVVVATCWIPFVLVAHALEHRAGGTRGLRRRASSCCRSPTSR